MENPQKATHVRNWKNYLIGILVILVTLLWFTHSCQNPPPVDDQKEIAYQDTIRALKAQVATMQHKKDSVFQDATKQIERAAQTIKQQDKRIAAARKREMEAVAKISELTKQEHPEVVEALAAKDTTIMEITLKADSLQQNLFMVTKQLQALEHFDVVQERAQAKMIQECEARREEDRQKREQAEKQAQKVPGLKKVIVWLGVALAIETAILAIK